MIRYVTAWAGAAIYDQPVRWAHTWQNNRGYAQAQTNEKKVDQGRRPVVDAHRLRKVA